MCEAHNRRTTRGKFKSGWRHTVKRTLRNKRTAEGRLVTHGYSAADDIRFALFGEPLVSSTRYILKNANHFDGGGPRG